MHPAARRRPCNTVQNARYGPLMLTDKSGERRFSLSAELDVAEEGAVEAIEQFIAHLWTGNRAFAHQHIVEAELPSILTYAADGTDSRAMKSAEAMEEFVTYLVYQVDQSANMDW